MMRPLSLAMLTLAVLVLAFDVSWFRPLKPGNYSVGFSACVFGDYVAAVGSADDSAYVALLNKESGSVVKEWTGDYGHFFGCAVSGSVLYTAGDPGLYAFDQQLNVLRFVQPDGVKYTAVATANGYIYATGTHSGRLYVEKRTADLTPVANVTYLEEGWRSAKAYGVAVDPSTGNVWVAGYYEKNLLEKPLLLIFDSDLRLVRKIEPQMYGFFADVCFMGGYAYVSGNRTVLKFDRSGSLVTWSRGGGQLSCANGKVFVFWYAKVADGYRLGYTVLDADLRELKTDVLARNSYEAAFYAPGRPDTDGKRVYAAATVEGEDNAYIWVFAVPADVSIIQQIPIAQVASLLKLAVAIVAIALSVAGWILNKRRKKRQNVEVAQAT